MTVSELERDREQTRVLDWRLQRALELGLDFEQAQELAHSDADLHQLENLLAAGCPVATAWEIVRP